jgi:rhodanese-related sulfurtransferase
MHGPMRYLLLLLLAIPLPQAWADKPSAPPEVEGASNLTAEGVAELILNEPKLVVIDARKEEEYAKGHIEGAISLLDSRMTPEALAAHVSNKETPLLFYCNGANCLRSSNAVTKAVGWGYRHLYWFRGGWIEWTDKRLPVVR